MYLPGQYTRPKESGDIRLCRPSYGDAGLLVIDRASFTNSRDVAGQFRRAGGTAISLNHETGEIKTDGVEPDDILPNGIEKSTLCKQPELAAFELSVLNKCPTALLTSDPEADLEGIAEQMHQRPLAVARILIGVAVGGDTDGYMHRLYQSARQERDGEPTFFAEPDEDGLDFGFELHSSGIIVADVRADVPGDRIASITSKPKLFSSTKPDDVS